MVELVHDDVIIKIRCGFSGEVLRIKGLNRHKQVVDAVRLIAADKHFTEVCILQHRTESIKTLF